jgi:DNA primase
MMAGRIIIPITHWDPVTNDAYLVAHAGRILGESPDADTVKYLFPPDFHKSAVVYNLIGAGRYAHEQGLILTEGFFSVMRLWQFGVRTAVSIMGNSLSKQEEKLIVNTVGIGSGNVTLMFDPDDAGRRCRDDVLNRLIRKVSVRVVDLDEPPDELSERSLRAALHL